MTIIIIYYVTIHDDHEEVYYIMNGTGKIKVGNEETEICLEP